MDSIVFVIAVPAAFVAGVLVHKYVVSEAEKIKQHVSAEIAVVHSDVAKLVNRICRCGN